MIMRILFLLAFVCTALIAGAKVYAQSAFYDPNTAVQGTGSSSGGADLVPVTPTVDGGSVPVGNRAQVIVRFRNDGGRAVQMRDINLYESSNVDPEEVLNQCQQEPLEPGAECAIVLAIKGLQAGPWRVEMLVRHTGKTRLATATLSGSVAPGDNPDAAVSKDIEVVPAPIDFGVLQNSRPIIRSVTLRNITSEPITIQEMYIDSPGQTGYDLKADCEVLLAGQACLASIVWSPLTEGPSSGFLVIEHDGPSRISNIPLSGEFNPAAATQAQIFPDAVPGKGLLVSSEVSVDFGSGIETKSAITVSLVNVGDAPVMIRNLQLAGSENGLQILQNGCTASLVLETTEACPMTLVWSPSKAGSIIDDIQIYHTGARGILVIPVRGEAAAAVNLDTKPVFLSSGGETIMDVESDSGDYSPPPAPTQEQQAAPVLDGYTVTSHSSNYAIISGPGGSRVVKDGQSAIVAGHRWNVSIVDEGVELNNRSSRVILVFDRSFSSLSEGTTSTSSSSGGE